MTNQRFDTVDALRGLAMVWMAVYHFVFDLNYFKLVTQDFYRDPFWTWQRTLIVSLFLLCSGIGQAIATAQGQCWRRFWRRWAQVATCALLVTAGSWLMFPNSFIYFGVLHGLALMLIVVRLTAHWGRWLWLLGALAIASKFIAESLLQTGPFAPWADLLNSMRWNWLGWISQKPVTEDYVPLFPWLGVMWWGAAAGTWVLRHRPEWLAQSVLPSLHVLAGLGRWSLSYYLLHQPMLIALVGCMSWLL
ncbi:heparan-alpha-glucosaminide N-acetyltransferase [Rhodoferax ferrireducens]|uniref:heparan-alpha-glucosaminide N-acetyltransferase n=1 Tax=Rhodoferax ferrireducens TaxID=192843 RepID=UPI00298E6116|nr:heparan-alpha-glucosaminide N-acetyltransferase [Rhodoferax ferrireducens]WPC67565.1 heparan-alpha-glucosaminide N-acetyltransferase [Rhodoferax ferrireducens]